MTTTREFASGIRTEMLKQLAAYAADAGWRISGVFDAVTMARGGEECALAVWDPADLPIGQRYKEDDPAHPQAIVVLPGRVRAVHEIGTLKPTDDLPARVASILRPFLTDLDR